MEYALAALILNETGEEINEHNLTAVLEAAGAPIVESRTKALVAALEGVDLDTATRGESVTDGGRFIFEDTESAGETNGDSAATESNEVTKAESADSEPDGA
ncbi:Ribosomal protein L12E/L44/L45/RPP1/RPP2 [Halanaeroarchaeum sp. HSR-CO]|uniref:50S ribosomal protein P1 n=1 Tax=Halanaeroarchaeum sp. HSR-CO TaxID=2866382 RepID=UPI002877FB02|nr:50S ribosomal protein P1 [Halanaeroarchaeum sp. HSR-CO]UWG46977.1 Ribosomal protein L12E/L44/L45/RPP1/RPP2 [Halanaeroarchaeum sp. HSR-CO]